MKGLGDPFQHHRAERVALAAEEPARRAGEPLDGSALLVERVPQRRPVTAPGEERGLGASRRITGAEQGTDVAALGPDELVDPPGGE